ncbi:MAG TPA: J domain-containing protein [Spirochaetia bacterium]|nr:J domain-containing protein [Spirochaetia bacterium]
MDGIFDRLGDLLRSIIQTDEDPQSTSSRPGHGDPDMQAAWDELDDYLNTEKKEDGPSSGGANRGSDRQSRATSRDAGLHRGPMDELRQDYRNLEVPFGASFDEVRKAYKNLLIEYHPDKHSASPEKLRIATEITKKINSSFQRIKRYHETGNV